MIPCVLFIGCSKDSEPTSEPVNEVKVLFSDNGKTLYRFSPDNDETEYTVPEGVEIISTAAFEDCGNLKKVVLPTSLTKIEEKAFYSCSELTSVEINSDIAVNEEAFSYCRELSNIDTSKIIRYDRYAFYICDSLASVTIAKEVINLPEGVFMEFGYCEKGLYSVTFEESSQLKYINEKAFMYNTNLSSIDIPASCEKIGSRAFACTGLLNITIGNNIDYFGSGAFSSCEKLTTVEFETTTSFSNFEMDTDDSYLFANCSNLTTVINYPSTDIGRYCFQGCSKLSSITFYDSVGKIGRYAFEDCYSLKELTISYTPYIESHAFYQCYNLLKLTILKEIGICDPNAVYFCDNLFEIYNLSNNELIKGEGVARYAKDIYTSLDTPSKIKTINNVLYYDNGTDFIALAPTDRAITAIEFDSKTTEINAYAFKYCENLTSIILKEGITKIGFQAFDGCKIASLEIPESLVEISSGAFDYYTLNTVIINNEAIADSCVKYSDNGYILRKAETVYIKTGLSTEDSTYLLENFTKQASSDKTGYDMYIRNN